MIKHKKILKKISQKIKLKSVFLKKKRIVNTLAYFIKKTKIRFRKKKQLFHWYKKNDKFFYLKYPRRYKNRIFFYLNKFLFKKLKKKKRYKLMKQPKKKIQLKQKKNNFFK